MRRGHGLSVHRADCEHVTRGKQTDPQRWMPIGWQDDLPTQAMFAVHVELTVTDSRATIAAVAAALAQEGSSIVGVNMGDKAPGEEFDTMTVIIQVTNRLHLVHTLRRLARIGAIRSIARKLDGDKRIRLSSAE